MTPFIGSHFLCRFCILDVKLLTLEIYRIIFNGTFLSLLELDKDFSNFKEMDRIYG